MDAAFQDFATQSMSHGANYIAYTWELVSCESLTFFRSLESESMFLLWFQWGRFLICNLSRSQTHCVCWAGLDLTVLLTQASKSQEFWIIDRRLELPCPSQKKKYICEYEYICVCVYVFKWFRVIGKQSSVCFWLSEIVVSICDQVWLENPFLLIEARTIKDAWDVPQSHHGAQS